MNRDFLYTTIVLLVAMVVTVKWHHNTDNSESASLQADTVYICNLLGEKLTAKDVYIADLEKGIQTQYNLIVQLKETIELQERALQLFIDEPVITIEPPTTTGE
jgi:hypothetical protein